MIGSTHLLHLSELIITNFVAIFVLECFSNLSIQFPNTFLYLKNKEFYVFHGMLVTRKNAEIVKLPERNI